MQIQWYDDYTLLIKSKTVRVVINPINLATQKVYSFLKETDLLITTQKQRSPITSGFLINGAGEYSYRGATVRILAYSVVGGVVKHIVSLSVENMLVSILFGEYDNLTTEQVEFIGSPDILIISLPDKSSLENILGLINAIEARIVIPTYTQPEQLQELLDEYGLARTDSEELQIKKVDLPTDSTQIYPLQKKTNS